MRQAGHFYKVIDEKTILVAQDTQQNRKEYEDQVVRTFFLSNGDVKDVSAMVRGLLDLRRMATITAAQRDRHPRHGRQGRRGRAAHRGERQGEGRGRPRRRAPPAEHQEAPRPRGRALELQHRRSRPVDRGRRARRARPITSLPWNELLKLSLSDFNFTIPSIIINFIKTNTDAEILAQPQLRIAEGEKAQLVIGDRVPIPVTTINTQQAIGQVGVVPMTSFQYQDVGIKLDIETRVHHNKEVSLKLTVEVSNLNGYGRRRRTARSSRSSAPGRSRRTSG